MAIAKVEYLDDRLRIHEDFRQPDGIPDDDTFDILYDSILDLEPLPAGKAGHEIPVPQCNQTIVLVEHSWPETSYGKRMYEYRVFLKK